MPKISVIVPVYNTEKYVEKCLNSILEQTMQDFEIVVVNDGSTDASEEIINRILNEHPDQIKYVKKENGGLSDARNYGIQKATGDYLCFVDSDDFIAKDLFKKVEKCFKKNVDIIKFKTVKVDEDYNEIERIDGPVFEEIIGQDAFNKLCFSDVLLEAAWIYIYRREFWNNNKFAFSFKMYHEDWGLIPYVITKANSVSSLNYYGYYYVQSSNSITRNDASEKNKKRANDMLFHYDNYISVLGLDNELYKKTKVNFKKYISNCLILEVNNLPKEAQNNYIKELKKRKIYKNIKACNLKQFIKKIILRISIKLYLKLR